ncbi:MAG: hypothetical protein IJX20_03860 [Alphaproteobacteria bacterium]|nr:hypothetical protein [Alphaproteobacteria bacterium]
MGLFGGSKSSSTVTNYTTTISQSLGDLANSNIQSAGDVSVNGMWGEDLQVFLDNMENIVNTATASNSNLAGDSIAAVAKGYQSAYSETTGMIQELKPVLMVGAGILAIVLAPKILKGL